LIGPYGPRGIRRVRVCSPARAGPLPASRIRVFRPGPSLCPPDSLRSDMACEMRHTPKLSLWGTAPHTGNNDDKRTYNCKPESFISLPIAHHGDTEATRLGSYVQRGPSDPLRARQRPYRTGSRAHSTRDTAHPAAVSRP
jgi:hypothetical protein